VAAARGSLANSSCGAALAVTGRRSMTTFQDKYAQLLERWCSCRVLFLDLFALAHWEYAAPKWWHRYIVGACGGGRESAVFVSSRTSTREIWWRDEWASGRAGGDQTCPYPTGILEVLLCFLSSCPSRALFGRLDVFLLASCASRLARRPKKAYTPDNWQNVVPVVICGILCLTIDAQRFPIFMRIRSAASSRPKPRKLTSPSPATLSHDVNPPINAVQGEGGGGRVHAPGRPEAAAKPPQEGEGSSDGGQRVSRAHRRSARGAVQSKQNSFRVASSLLPGC